HYAEPGAASQVAQQVGHPRDERRRPPQQRLVHRGHRGGHVLGIVRLMVDLEPLEYPADAIARVIPTRLLTPPSRRLTATLDVERLELRPLQLPSQRCKHPVQRLLPVAHALGEDVPVVERVPVVEGDCPQARLWGLGFGLWAGSRPWGLGFGLWGGARTRRWAFGARLWAGCGCRLGHRSRRARRTHA